ncbi:MAG: carbohydrate ABC transporter permease [Anaerolineae bacterium]|jgi:multiple sugar transport system permease protein
MTQVLRQKAGMALERKITHVILHLILITAGITFLVPFFWVASTSLKVPGEVFSYPIRWIPPYPEWGNYTTVFSLVKIVSAQGKDISAVPTWMRNTLELIVMGTLGSLISCSLVAYGLTRIRWRGREFVFALVLGTMMLPGVVTLVPTFIMFRDFGWIDTYLPLIVPSWLAANSFYIFLLRQFFLGLPMELDEAAIVDGASGFRILWQLILPLSKPALAAVGVFSFMAQYSEFMGPLLYINNPAKYPISVGLRFVQGSYGNQWPYVMALVMMSLVPVIMLFFFAQKTFIQGVQMTGIAGR